MARSSKGVFREVRRACEDKRKRAKKLRERPKALPRRSQYKCLVKLESNFYVDQRGNWFAARGVSRLEYPLTLDDLDGLLVQSHADSADEFHVACAPARKN